MVRLFQTVARGSDVILDIGANIGLTTLLFAELGRSVHSFEPSPVTHGFLERNIARAQLTNVTTHQYGLGAETFEATLTYAPADRTGAFVSHRTTASTGHTVETIAIRRLDEVTPELGSGRIDFVKIDVEGFEADVIRGAANMLETHHPVAVLELNHWALNALQRTNVPDYFDFLCSVFPIVLAVDGRSYLDLHVNDERYHAMHQHIVKWRYGNLVVAFDESKLADFRAQYQQGPGPTRRLRRR